MTTCYRFDRGPDGICRTCGRETVFYPSRRRNASPGDGSWQHAGPSIAETLAALETRRKVDAK